MGLLSNAAKETKRVGINQHDWTVFYSGNHTVVNKQVT
jgi:hypothetical protein